MTKKTYQLEAKIKELKNKISEIKKEKQTIQKKDNKIRKFLIINTLLSAGVHLIGSFINPAIVIFALFYLLITVIPAGSLSMFYYSYKEEKCEKEIKTYNDNIELLKKELDTINKEEEMNKISNIRTKESSFINNKTQTRR